MAGSARKKRPKSNTLGVPKTRKNFSLQPRPQNIPLWAPDGVDLEVVPPEIKQAIAELVQPIYEQFVVNASDALEKSIGITISHLLWLEILEQLDIKREYIQIEAVLNISHNRPEMIERHLRLIDSKLRIGYFLLRIKELQNRLTRQAQHYPPLLTDTPAASSTNLVLGQLPNPQNQTIRP